MTKQKKTAEFALPNPPLLIPSGYISLREAVELASSGINLETASVGGCSAPEDRLRRFLHNGLVSALVQLHEDGTCFPLPFEEWAGPRAPMFFEGEGQVFIPGDAEMLTGDWAFVRVHRAQLMYALQDNSKEKNEPPDYIENNKSLNNPSNSPINKYKIQDSNLKHPSVCVIRGRKPTYDWPEIQIFVIKLLEHYGLPSSDDPHLPNQAAIERRIMEYCQRRYGREPAPSNIRPKLAKWLAEFKKIRSEINF